MIGDVNVESERRPGRPRDPQVDEAVSHAVVEVLARCGMSGFTVDKVASAAGVGKATIYRRWPSREDLIQEVWEHIHEETPKPDTGDLRTDLDVFVGHLAEFVSDPDRRQAILHVVAAAAVDPELGRRLADFKRTRGEAVRRIVRQAKKRGELRSGLDEGVVAEMIVAGIFFRVLMSGGPVDRKHADRCVDIVLNGIVAR
jgi:AcrR family transcriptional regulator